MTVDNGPLQGHRFLVLAVRVIHVASRSQLTHHDIWKSLENIPQSSRSVGEHVSICRTQFFLTESDQVRIEKNGRSGEGELEEAID